MGDIGDTPNSNSDNDGERNESSDEDEENSTMEQAQPIVRESTRPSQPATNAVSNSTTDQITNQLIVREFDNSASSRYTILPSRYCGIDIAFFGYWLMSILMGLTISHSSYWFILVFIGLVIYVIDVVRSPVWTYDNRFRLRLGNTQPCPLDYTLGLDQGGTRAGRVAAPSDSLQPLVITYTFSTTITEYFPPLRESIAIDSTQPHTMPATTTGNSIGSDNRTTNGENSHPNTDDTTQNDGDEMMAPPVDIDNEPNIQAIVVGNTATGIPDEIGHFDLPDITNECYNESELDASSDDEQRLSPESSLSVDSDDDNDDLTSSSSQRGETSPNTEIITNVDQNNTPPNPSNVTDEQSIATASAIDSSSPQIPETKRDTGAPTEGDPGMILPETNPTIVNAPKATTSGNSSEELGGETNQ